MVLLNNTGKEIVDKMEIDVTSMHHGTEAFPRGHDGEGLRPSLAVVFLEFLPVVEVIGLLDDLDDACSKIGGLQQFCE